MKKAKNYLIFFQARASSIIALCVLMCVAASFAQTSCKYWCKTPEGQVYCCEDEYELPSVPTGKNCVYSTIKIKVFKT